jgi:hypothetical protein
MKYTTEMGSGAMTYEYIPSFIKTGSGIQKIFPCSKQVKLPP